MTNLEKFYPGKSPEDFRIEGHALAHEPDGSQYCMDCAECRACDFCDTDREHKTCVDTFEAWLKREAE